MSSNVLDQEIHVSVKNVILGGGGFALLLMGGIWFALELTIKPMEGNIAKTQEYIDELRAANGETTKDAHDVEIDLRQTLADLTAELRLTNERLAGLGGSLASLDQSVQTVNAALVQSVHRQEQFERWVALRLGPIEDSPSMVIPGKWGEQQDVVFKSLAVGDDPLTDWYESLKFMEK